MMRRGEIVDDGSPDQLLTRYGRENLEDVFLDIARGRRQAQDNAPENASEAAHEHSAAHVAFARAGRVLAAAHLRDGAALLVSAALVLAARCSN